MSNTIKNIEKRAHKFVNNTAKKANYMSKSAEDSMDHAMQTVRDKASDAQEYMSCGYNSLSDYVSQRPMKALGIAALIGGLIVMCCSSNRR